MFLKIARIEKRIQLKKEEDREFPLLIQTYLGFGNATTFHIKGRVLEDEGLLEKWSDSKLRNLWETFKRMESDEIPNAEVSIKIGSKVFSSITNEEGFFDLNGEWDIAIEEKSKWIPAEVILKNKLADNFAAPANVEFMIPSSEATFGVISDVDDTVLQTHMTSRMKLKMMYVSFMKGAHQRLPMEGMKDVLDMLCRDKEGEVKNPIFYVSNSPWNIYDVLKDFIAIQELPKGPLFLRDFGMNLIFKKNDFVPHKIVTIRKILTVYPDLNFVCLGDTASNDIDYYLQLSEEFPGRISTIIIRETRSTKNSRRIRDLQAKSTHPNFHIIKTSEEIKNLLVHQNLSA